MDSCRRRAGNREAISFSSGLYFNPSGSVYFILDFLLDNGIYHMDERQKKEKTK